jgi:hypothetical protein
LTQRKGERTAAQNERDHPHIVELAVRPSGFGATLDAMYEFHRARGLSDRRGRSVRRDDQDFVRWCFANAVDAGDFANAFEGSLVRPAKGYQCPPPKADMNGRQSNVR